MRARLFALAVVAAMIASTLLPAVAAEDATQGSAEGRELQADPPNCPDWEGVDALETAKTTEIATEALKEAAPRDLVLGAVVAGEGEVSTDGPNPLYVAAYVAYKAAQEAVVIIEMNHERYLECENGAHRELLRLVDDKIDELTTTVETDDAELQSSIDTVEQKVDQLTQITETDDTENNRIEIENALYPCTPLVGFYLPEANGGQIETVAEVVQEAIDGSSASGFNTTAAQSTYNNAVNIMNQGAYRDAFVGFCAAYGQLVAASGGGNSTQIARTYGSGYLNFCVNNWTGEISQSRNSSATPPLLDPSTLCKPTERPLQVLGWYYGG